MLHWPLEDGDKGTGVNAGTHGQNGDSESSAVKGDECIRLTNVYGLCGEYLFLELCPGIYQCCICGNTQNQNEVCTHCGVKQE